MCGHMDMLRDEGFITYNLIIDQETLENRMIPILNQVRISLVSRPRAIRGWVEITHCPLCGEAVGALEGVAVKAATP